MLLCESSEKTSNSLLAIGGCFSFTQALSLSRLDLQPEHDDTGRAAAAQAKRSKQSKAAQAAEQEEQDAATEQGCGPVFGDASRHHIVAAQISRCNELPLSLALSRSVSQ